MRMRFGLSESQLEEYKSAFQRGYDAHGRGMTYQQNPYQRDTVAHDGWRRGWTSAEAGRNVRR